MKKTTLFIAVQLLAAISLAACSSTDTGIKEFELSPRGISIANIYKEQRSRAYQAAEKHCAKYSKIPRKLKTIRETPDYAAEERVTFVFECVKPGR